MTNKAYFRPIAQTDACRPKDSLPLAGGASWFSHAEKLQPSQASTLVPISAIPEDVLATISAPRAAICGLAMDQPRLMGVLNVTPDSFSDGGQFDDAAKGQAQGEKLLADGADILDIGGESTRPGADFVAPNVEIARTAPVIAALNGPVISIDTRKSDVAKAAMDAGASLINDVSAFEFDPLMIDVARTTNATICLMHTTGDPKTMQAKAAYQNVLLEVYDYLAARVDFCVANGIARDRIVVDPGIGFGKTQDHNLALIRGLSLFHGLGCAILLGVSRKRFIGTIGNEPQADKRAPGSIALALEGVRQGVQILRVHDIKQTKQALALWQAAHTK